MTRILLAEAHGPTREFVERRLADQGFEVLAAGTAVAAWERFAEARTDIAVLGADLAEARWLSDRLRQASPRLLLVVADKGHLGRASGKRSAIDLHPNAYVADPTGRELTDRLAQLLSQAEGGVAEPGAPDGVAAVLARPPAAQGEVRQGALGGVLHQLWRTGAQGILLLSQRESARRVFLLRGGAVDFDSDVRSESLGRWLVETRRITEEQYLASLDVMVSGGLSAGAAMVASGALEPGEELYGTLRSHVRAMVSRCMGLRDGRWRFHSGLEFTSEVRPLEIPPLAPILEGARAHLPVRHFAEALRPVQRAFPARTAAFQQLLPAMSLGTADLRLALDLDGRTQVRAFLEARPRELKETYALLWFLSLVGAVAFHPAPAQADAFVYRDPSPPRKKPLPEDRAEALRQAALQILPGSYFKALGLDITAGVDEVERAYHEAATRFHPDGFAEFDLGGLEDLLSQVQDRVSAAYRVLSVDEKRKAYLTFLLARYAGETGRRRREVDAEAEIAFKRGELALRQRHFTLAAEAFREASDRCPKEPEYLAMLAFALLRDPAVDRARRPRESARVARKALALDPACVRAVISLALAEEAQGDTTGARRHLLAALKVAPDNLVAKRALQRLNRVRR